MLIDRALKGRADGVAVQRKPRVRRVVTDLSQRRRVRKAKKGADKAEPTKPKGAKAGQGKTAKASS
jgi:hypothetical protein